METANGIGQLAIGGAAGGGLVALLALLMRLLFAREKSEYARLEARIIALEGSLHTEQVAHLECVRKMGLLEGRVAQLTTDMNEIIGRHSKNNELHKVAVTNAIAEMQAKQHQQEGKS